MTDYVTVQGDMWDSISYKVYGTENAMSELMAANPQYIHIAIFSAGVRLIVPVRPVDAFDNLPPWKRGE